MASFEASRTALLAYAKENGGRLPEAAKWQTATEPYYARLRDKFVSEGLPAEFRPQEPGRPFVCDWNGQKTGIAFNRELGGKLVSEIKEPAKTPLIFEVPTSELNQNLEFQELNTKEAPKIFMNRRDWIVFYVEGNRNPFESDRSTSSTFEISIEDALTPPKSTEPPKPPALPAENTQ